MKNSSSMESVKDGLEQKEIMHQQEAQQVWQCQTNWNHNKILVLITCKHKVHVVKNLVDPKS
jgi:hypothetical protein